MKCRNCDGTTMVSRIKYHDDGDKRKRKCLACGLEFWTVECVESVAEDQAFQAFLFRTITEANGSRERAKNLTDCQVIGESQA